jgi:hypothetical protein
VVVEGKYLISRRSAGGSAFEQALRQIAAEV